MRNITFISAICAVGMASAQEMPEYGCYMRDYSQAHLDQHPDQVVRTLHMRVSERYGSRIAQLQVAFADQGHIARDGVGPITLQQNLVCFNLSDGSAMCGVECDGGGFTVAKSSADSMTLRTEYLMIATNESCGGMVDLAEREGEAVNYRLNRVDAVQCAMFKD